MTNYTFFFFFLQEGTNFLQSPNLKDISLSVIETITEVMLREIVRWKKLKIALLILHFQMQSILQQPRSLCLCQLGLLRADEAGHTFSFYKAHARIRFLTELLAFQRDWKNCTLLSVRYSSKINSVNTWKTTTDKKIWFFISTYSRIFVAANTKQPSKDRNT